MFFVYREPAVRNKDIFNLTSLLHTKIKMKGYHTMPKLPKLRSFKKILCIPYDMCLI